MVGMTLALAAGRLGLSTLVVDRAPPPAQVDPGFDGRVSAIAQGSKRFLDALGLWEDLEPNAEAIREIRVSDRDSRLYLHYDHADVGTVPLGYILENRHLRLAMLDALSKQPTVAWVAPTTVASIDQGRDGVRARLEDGSVVDARLLAAADGRASATREHVGIGAHRADYQQTAIVCTVAHETPHRGIAHERFLPAGPFAILPMTGNRSSLVWTERRDLAPALMALPDDAFTAEMASRFGDFMGDLSVEGDRWSYPVGLVLAESFVSRRVVLVGDAAHAIHPIAGQGLNLGLRDIEILIQLVSDAFSVGLDIGQKVVTDGYGAARGFDTLSMTGITDGLNRLFRVDAAPVRWARDFGLAAVDQVPPLKRVFMRHAMGLTQSDRM